MSRLNATFVRSHRVWALLLLALVGSAVWSSRNVSADLTAPQPMDRAITQAVTQKLQIDHLSHRRLDDEMSQRWLKNYIKDLDPLKVYFTQSDIDEFEQHKDDLDDWARQHDIRLIQFGHSIFQRFLVRIEQRVKLVDELLAEKLDFTTDENMVIEPDAAVFAHNDAEVRDLWRKRVKYDLLGLKAKAADAKEAEARKAAGKNAKDKPSDDAAPGGPVLGGDEEPAVARKSAADKSADDKLTPSEKVSRRYHSLAKRWRQTDNIELLERYLTALTTSYDPHSSYMAPDSTTDFDIQMKLTLDGIGASLQATPEGDTVIQKIIPGGAADKDKRLMKDDKVLGVGQGESGEIVDVSDMKLRDVVKLIRGERGTTVRLKVLPAHAVEPKIYNIVRAKVELTESEARSQIIEAGRKPGGAPYKIGVIDLPSFYMDMEGFRDDPTGNYKSTTRDVARLLEKFNNDKVDAVVLDLRRNGGGSLTESINMTGLFIDSGPVVQIKDSDKRVQHYDDPERGMLWSGPLVVLTSKFSASASEIFAGAIQDYHRGLVVGDTSTHGKGTVQSLQDISKDLFHVPNARPLGSLKVTIQQFYRPNGDSTQNRGVLADVELPSITSHLDIGESSYDYALKFDHVPQVPYRPYDLVKSEMVQGLKANSTKRCEESKDFVKLGKKIARYEDQKNRKNVSLNEKVFMAEWAEINADKEQEKEMEEINDPNRPVFDTDSFYSKEIVAVTLDYIRALQGGLAPATVGQSDRVPAGPR
ncbi:MAG TPA: carboxy terminal-processing peptidase [Pirellulales bacterium]|jgi:carboxyl-terminal processing protease|nr:carboxy terminal-processing peptidase [Pirellulales bacterium]